MHRPELHIAGILKSLQWRGVQQLKISQTSMLLCKHRYCQISAMEKPIDYYAVPPQVSWLHNVLSSFTGLHEVYVEGYVAANIERAAAVSWLNFG